MAQMGYLDHSSHHPCLLNLGILMHRLDGFHTDLECLQYFSIADCLLLDGMRHPRTVVRLRVQPDMGVHGAFPLLLADRRAFDVHGFTVLCLRNKVLQKGQLIHLAEGVQLFVQTAVEALFSL